VSATSSRPDPVEAEIERALDPGRFVSDRGCFRFVDSLEQVAATIGRLVTDEPERAATLYETFLAGCHEKAEDVDDSSGSFGMFAQSVISGWITARQAAQACPQQTTAHLLAWMDNDEYGFCHRLEREIATVFDEAGLAAFIDQIRSRFEAADQAAPASVGSDQAARQRRAETLRWAETLRSLYAARGDLDAYVDLADRTGLTTDDCLTVANLLVTRGDPAQALSWVERGLELDAHRPYPSFAAHSLTELKPRLLADVGHGEQALETAWASYRKHPDRYSYDHLMTFVPQAERPRLARQSHHRGPGRRPLPACGDRTAAAHRRDRTPRAAGSARLRQFIGRHRPPHGRTSGYRAGTRPPRRGRPNLAGSGHAHPEGGQEQVLRRRAAVLRTHQALLPAGRPASPVAAGHR
jgi:hypothetical protein